MYSAGISRQSLVALRKKIRKRFSKLARTLDKANRQMMELEENLAETGKGYQVLPNPGVLPITFLTISGELEEILEEKELEEELRREILEFYFIVRDFLNVSELVDENYVVYTENNAEEGFRLRLFCVNPAENLGEYLKKGKSAIFFSATMFPMLYYRELLTTDRDAYGIYVQSPFPKENRRILIGSDVSSGIPGEIVQNTGRSPDILPDVSGRGREIIWCFFRRIVLWKTYCKFMRKNFP